MQNKEQQHQPKEINILAVILNLGHEAYSKKSIDSLYTHIVNNSRIVSPYDMSCIIDTRKGKPKIVGIIASDKVNRNTEYCIDVENLLSLFMTADKPLEITREAVAEKKNNDKALKVFDKFITEQPKRRLYVLPLSQPDTKGTGFLWYIEYYNNPQPEEIKKMTLLALHYSEALWYFIKSTSGKLISNVSDKYSFYKTKTFIYGCLALVLFLLFIIKINQNVSAEFELMPKDRTIAYAPFPGIIESVNFKTGEKVNKGDIILKYDTENYVFALETAQNNYRETSAKLDLIRQTAFNDVKEIGKIKLYSIQQQIDKIEIERIKWILDKSILKADYSGTLIIDEDFRLKGKSVTNGEKLFEIAQPGKIMAEIFVNEADSSVVTKLNSVKLYLHNTPETAIDGKIISVSPVPVLTKTNQYCYVIKLELDSSNPGLLYGMRGVARVSGDRVTIAYYLFRNLILWWRKI